MKIKFVHILSIFILICLILFGVGVGLIFASFTSIDIEAEINNLELSIPTEYYDINNKLIAEEYEDKRELIPLKQIPENLINAFLAYEDKNFYNHHGINVKRTFVAAIRTFQYLITRSGYMQGASTITQQLAKRLFTESEKTVFRKLRELWFAIQIEKKYSKNEILELYLNEIYFGHNVYGIQAASQFYFKKNAIELTLGECSILAMLPQSPAKHSPINHPDTSKMRQEMVLSRMVENDFITEDQKNKAIKDFWINFKKKNFASNASGLNYKLNKAPYYIDAVNSILRRDSNFNYQELKTKGYRIYTAVNIEYQKIGRKVLKERLNQLNDERRRYVEPRSKYFAKDTVDEVDFFFTMNGIDTNIGSKKYELRYKKNEASDILDFLNLATLSTNSSGLSTHAEVFKENFKDYGKTKIIEGSLVSIEPKTGYVLTLIGGSGFSLQSQINRATTGRLQPGSSIKPFIYSGAINERLITPSTIIYDAPVIYQISEEETWKPLNYSGTYRHHVRVRDALRKSINIPAIKVLEALTIDKARDYLSEFYGVDKNDIGANLSLTLGTNQISPLQGAKAFSTLANQGRKVEPIIIRYITDREGNIIRNYEKEINEKLINMDTDELYVVSPQAAFLTTSILQDTNLPGGTAYRGLQPYELKFPLAGKTGTTSNWSDAWFNGYTPNLATVVWVGFDRNSSLGRGYTGGHVSAPIWGKFMKYIYEVLGRKIEYFSKPSGIGRYKINVNSGLLTTSDENSMYEYYIYGTQPKKYHNGISYFMMNTNAEKMEIETGFGKNSFSNNPTEDNTNNNSNDSVDEDDDFSFDTFETFEDEEEEEEENTSSEENKNTESENTTDKNDDSNQAEENNAENESEQSNNDGTDE